VAFLKRPRIIDGSAVEPPKEGQVEITYVEFLRQLLASDSDKKDYWTRHLANLRGENIVPIIESPIQGLH
jgi:hypothetical protein